MKSVQKIIVIGAGQMGSGIAQVAAVAGFDVVLNDIATEYVERGLATISKNLDRDVAKDRLTGAEKSEALKRIKPSVSLADASDVDLAIEAAIENMDVKAGIFRELDQIAP